MTSSRRPILFLLFFLSGASGLIYQVVWTRMAFAAFGIITPVMSVVLSVFMLGLSLGAWAGGRYIGALTGWTGRSALVFYGLAEFIIGLGAFAVPQLFKVGKQMLLAAGQSDSLVYLALSALVLAFSILPWCVFMGATFPLMMAYVREREQDAQSEESFSYLYLANVIGALCGTLSSAFVLIEIFGFRDTLRVAAAGNFLIAGIGLWLSRGHSVIAAMGSPAGQAFGSPEGVPPGTAATRFRDRESSANEGGLTKWILFTTGFASMAMEVVWVRAFAPVLKTQVYSFALVVAAYLGATFHGSLMYRRHRARNVVRSTGELLALLSAALLPILINNGQFMVKAWGILSPEPRFVFVLLASIYPFCAILGYLTPGLVDKYAGGSPERAGGAYAVNVLGCILGPLVAAYVLLPQLSERNALILLSLPFAGYFLALGKALTARQRFGLAVPLAGMLAGALFFPLTYEDYLVKYGNHRTQVRRDYAATVISCGKGFGRDLIVNGFGMTKLTPCTKFMAHLPLALHKGRPESALIICFGMGTSFRSALSWGVQTTAVELVPGVRDAFGYYHEDAAEVAKNPKGRVVIDDGRRYLQRTRDTYDVVVLDPPPPVETAGSSLLYSKEFYDAAKLRLNAGGIVQAWIPENSSTVFAAALRTLCDSFPYVRCFPSYEGTGAHMLASMQPIETCSPVELLSRMPSAARRDVLEWCSLEQLTGYLAKALAKQAPGENLLAPEFQVRITDDQPYNEYFLLRKAGLF